jgi:hypothetical protein
MNHSSDRAMIFNPMAQVSDLLSFLALAMFVGALLVVVA